MTRHQSKSKSRSPIADKTMKITRKEHFRWSSSVTMFLIKLDPAASFRSWFGKIQPRVVRVNSSTCWLVKDVWLVPLVVVVVVVVVVWEGLRVCVKGTMEDIKVEDFVDIEVLINCDWVVFSLSFSSSLSSSVFSLKSL